MTHWLQLVSDLDRKLKIFYLKEKLQPSFFKFELNLSWYHYIPWPWKPRCRVKKQYIICHSQEVTANLRKFINGRRFFAISAKCHKKKMANKWIRISTSLDYPKNITTNPPPPHRGGGSMVGPRANNTLISSYCYAKVQLGKKDLCSGITCISYTLYRYFNMVLRLDK